MFGDVKLNGVFKQKVSRDGDLWYKGVMHFFGSRLPIQVIIKPTSKAIMGEKLYYAFTYLPAQKYQAKSVAQKSVQRQMVSGRAAAEKKVKKILKTIGIIYGYKKNQKIIPTPEQCKRCIRRHRRGYVKRKKVVSKKKVRRVSATSKKDK